LGTLGVAGALAGLLLVLVNQWTEPRIEAHRAAVLQAAIHEVLGGPDRYETWFVVDGGLTAQLPAGGDSASFEQVYVGYDAAGAPLGLAIPGGKPGFQDVIRLIFGFDPGTGAVLGMKVLESKETPGLGDKIEKDSTFVGAFVGALAPILGLKAGSGTGDPHEIDMITGATISSRTVIAIINERLDELEAPLRTYEESAGASGLSAGRVLRSEGQQPGPGPTPEAGTSATPGGGR
jgi:electron transport complex protein RnfG